MKKPAREYEIGMTYSGGYGRVWLAVSEKEVVRWTPEGWEVKRPYSQYKALRCVSVADLQADWGCPLSAIDSIREAFLPRVEPGEKTPSFRTAQRRRAGEEWRSHILRLRGRGLTA